MKLDDFEKEEKGFIGRAWDAVGWKTKTAFVVAALGTATYLADYAVVAGSDVVLGDFNITAKSHGSYTGTIPKASLAGFGLCTSLEGVVQTGNVNSGKGDSYPFSVRLWDWDAIQAVLKAHHEKTEVELPYTHSMFSQESFDNNGWLRCIQRRDHAVHGAIPTPK